MRILIYGAGVIGSLYAVLFAETGYDTSIYARGKRLEFLKKNGLLYKKNQNIRRAEATILGELSDNDAYDFILLTVRENQLYEALAELKNNKSNIIVTMVNSLDSYKKWEEMRENTEHEKQKFFEQMIAGNLSMADALETGKKYEMSLSAGMYNLLLFRFTLGEENRKSGELLGEAEYAIEKLTERLEYVFEFQRGVEGWAFLLMADNEEQMSERVKELSKDLEEIMKNYSTIAYFGGIGQPVARLRELEAGTFMFAAAATKGDVTVLNVIPKHLEATIAKLVEIGCEVEEFDDAVRVVSKGDLTSTHVKTLPYPGFPTDMQPQIGVTLALCKGTSIITESIFENRFKYLDELARMGANVKVEGNSATIEGVTEFSGARVSAPDLRAGAALCIAGLAADGITIVDDIVYIQRGYERFEEKLRGIGGIIEKVDSEKAIQKFKLKVG